MHGKRFNPEHMARLDNAERCNNFPPEKLLELLPIRKIDNILDLGAGTGYLCDSSRTDDGRQGICLGY